MVRVLLITPHIAVSNIERTMSYEKINTNPVPRKIQSLYAGRIRQFTDNGQYRDLNLPAYYDRDRKHEDHVKLEVYSVPDLARPLFHKAIKDATWKEAKVGDQFGPSWSTHWFKISVKIPSSWSEYKESPLFEFDSSDEGFVYLSDGTPQVGLSGEHRRKEWTLPEDFADGQWHTFYIETACNNIQGNFSPPDPNRYFRLQTADLVVPNSIARALFVDFWLIGDASREFDGEHWQRGRALDVANRVINAFDPNNLDKSLLKCREIAAEYIGSKVDSHGVYSSTVNEKLGLPTSSKSNLIYAVGNCHIDTAWLWPFAETRRKIARSFASQLDLLDRYPEYVFAASQMQQFEWLKDDYPELWDRVARAIKGGRFIPIGGSWVECDTNMPTGESLVRQTLLGQNYIKDNFGKKAKTFWLPDTFGYAPQLPQVCRLAGMDHFLTQKLSWNNINVFPNTTFNWIGLDGTQVLCHMPPANTYTAEAHFGDVKRSMTQHKNLDVEQHSLLLYGYGDGGGGPTAEMLEKLRRCRGLSDTVGELPRVHSGRTPDDFFEEILACTDYGKTLVSWNGELYLEYHRGAYTTQAAIKRYNRVCERLLHDLELVATTASLTSEEYEYPFKKIERLWKNLCLCQFHDVLPGSGINMIYKDAREIFAKIEEDGRALVWKAFESLGIVPPTSEGVVLTELGAKNSRFTVPKSSDLIENSRFKVELKKGILTSVYDKEADREVLAGHGNQLLLFEDQPMNFPAWDTEQYAGEKVRKLVPVEVYVEGDAVVSKYEFNKSTATVKTRLSDYQVEFEVDADWHETYQFLKTEFVVDVINDFASYETAFGVHRRPTHYNTTWDVAKFEVCGHRFADLSDWSYGVSILNNCKYGYSIHGNTMHLSLLRSPKSPDPDADMGKHHFKYAFKPHQGSLGPDTVRAALDFNALEYVISPPKRPVDLHIVGITGSPNVVLSAVKRAERDRTSSKAKSVVVRIYETLGGKAAPKIVSRLSVARAVVVNSLEEELEELDVFSDADLDSIPIKLNSFEVKAVRLDF